MHETRIGMVTIGQSPRDDVVPDMAAILGSGVGLVERGALDGLDPGGVAALAPRPGDDLLVTRLADGRPVFVGKARILDRLAAAIACRGAGGATTRDELAARAVSRPAAGPAPAPSLRPVSLDEIEALAIGAWILGTGGGGSPTSPSST